MFEAEALACVPGALVNVGVLALWLVTRTTGLPFGPHAGGPEHMGVLDVTGQLTVAIALFPALRPPAGPGGHRLRVGSSPVAARTCPARDSRAGHMNGI
ncbi:hypothetical protein C3Y87_12455 [Carbonactinospora thermoautotrophica]|uniref:hypothetical protein n=1 Tax=Carbonactinospora thermoautotrophica TaxID=1469144 RepID=UPI00226F90F0|nr:hypothetical protein [Carbonactinospora thermoautotrophica]MCX9192210.1 hypothetical protein [Carbonactinospora thermoautotrophica]